MNKHLIFRIVGYASIGIMAGFVFMVHYWIFNPYKTVDYSGQYKTEKTIYTQGEQSYYVVDYCKYTDLAPTINKNFVDGIIFEATEKGSVLPEGCHTVKVSMRIPETLPPGVYYLETNLSYKVNPIRSITKSNRSNTFTVVSKNNQEGQ